MHIPFFWKKSYKKAIFLNIIFSHLSSHLQKFLRHRRVQYLKLILWRHSFDHLKCTFALGIVVFAAEVKISVHFFLRHPIFPSFLRLSKTVYFLYLCPKGIRSNIGIITWLLGKNIIFVAVHMTFFKKHSKAYFQKLKFLLFLDIIKNKTKVKWSLSASKAPRRKNIYS